MSKEDFTIYSGECICLIRTLCNRTDFCEILNKIKNSLDFTQADKKTVAFLMYKGTEYSIEKMLEKNLRIKNFATSSNYVENVDRNEFVSSKKRRFVFEVSNDEKNNIVKSFIVGPGQNQNLVFNALIHIFDRNNFNFDESKTMHHCQNGIEILKSSIPFRG